MEHHVSVKNAEDLCVPKEKARAILAFGKEFGGAPYSYRDTDEFAVLLGPDAGAEEKAEVPAADRAAVATKTRSTVYFTTIRTCSFTYLESLGQASGSCELGHSNSLFVGAPPNVQRKQECKEVPGIRCSDRCEDNGDCRGFFCGCRESVCTIFGTCTGCPSSTFCEDPMFTVTSAPWSVSYVAKTPAQKEFAKTLNSQTVVLGFTVQTAWRRVTTAMKSDYGETPHRFVENNTGYHLGITPLVLSAMDCKGSDCGASSAVNGDVYLGGPYRTTVDYGDKRVTVACPRDACTATAK